MSAWHDRVVDLTLFEALTGGAFDRQNGNIAGNLTKIFQKSQMPRGLPRGGGVMGGFGIDRYLILFFVNHFWLPTPCRSFLTRGWTLMNHDCKRVLSDEGKYLTLHTFLLFRLRKHVTLHNFLLFHLRSHIKNSCFTRQSKLFETIKALLGLWNRYRYRNGPLLPPSTSIVSCFLAHIHASNHAFKSTQV